MNMKRTLISLGSLWALAVLLGAWTPWRNQHMIQMGSVLAAAAAVFGVFRMAVGVINRRRGPDAATSTPNALGAEFWSARPRVVFLIGFLAETGWLVVGRAFASVVITEGVYYLILLIVGYVLSRWCNSRQYVPVLTAILSLLIGTSWQTIQFLINPAAQFQFGPEIVIFAASETAGRLTMLPLDAAITWGGWLIGHVIRPTCQRMFGERK